PRTTPGFLAHFLTGHDRGAGAYVRSVPTRRSSDLGATVVFAQGSAAPVLEGSTAPGGPGWERPLLDLGTPEHPLLATWAVLLARSEEHTSELQSRENLVCRLLLEEKMEYPVLTDAC